jgi:signal transduction histidine kinase
VDSITNKIVATLKEEKEKLEKVLKDLKEKKEAALKDGSMSQELREYYDTEIQKLEAELVALTKPNVGLDVALGTSFRLFYLLILY